MQETNNLSFLAIRLYRQQMDQMDDAWRDYMKNMAVCLYKKGIFRVTINRLKSKGLLSRDRDPNLMESPEVIEEVMNFDKMLNPLLTYFAKYEGRNNYSLLPNRSPEEDKDEEEFVVEELPEMKKVDIDT